MIINADDTYDIANQILLHDLPSIDECEEDERQTFIDECRWALGEKVKQVALMHAFREDPKIVNQTLQSLCLSAREKISNPSFIASVQEFVLRDLDLQKKSELHPLLAVVEAQAFTTCNRIIRSLGKIIQQDVMNAEAR